MHVYRTHYAQTHTHTQYAIKQLYKHARGHSFLAPGNIHTQTHIHTIKNYINMQCGTASSVEVFFPSERQKNKNLARDKKNQMESFRVLGFRVYGFSV